MVGELRSHIPGTTKPTGCNLRGLRAAAKILGASTKTQRGQINKYFLKTQNQIESRDYMFEMKAWSNIAKDTGKVPPSRRKQCGIQ